MVRLVRLTTIGLVDAPEPKHVGHPKCIAYTGTRSWVAHTMSGARVLAARSSHVRHQSTEHIAILPEAIEQQVLHINPRNYIHRAVFGLNDVNHNIIEWEIFMYNYQRTSST